jgi:hypothetical protein
MKQHQSDAFVRSSMYHFSELEYMEEPHYLLKTSEVFPYDQEQHDFKSSKK